jgi:outer membrane protein assembly factor BamB
VERGYLWSKVPGGHELQASHTLVDGVLVCSRRTGGGLVGIDPETGKELWQAKGQAYQPPRTGYASPVKWVHQGPSTGSGQAKEYALTGNALIEPKTGKILWQIPGSFGAGPTANAEYMMCHAPFSIWRITPEKATKVWELPEPTAEQKAEWLKIGGNPSESQAFGNMDWNSGVVSGNAFLLPARRGASWSVRLDANGQWKAVRYDQNVARELTATGSPILSGDLVLTPRESNGPSLIQWAAATGDLKLVNLIMETDNAMCTSPALVDGRLFLRSDDGIVCFDLRQQQK